MPCDSSYMSPTSTESASQKVAIHLCYILKALDKEPTKEMSEAAKSYYGLVRRLDEWTALLCKTCNNLSKEEQNRIIYDGRIKEARALADWWEAHQEQDARRKRNEEAKKLSKQEKQEFASRVDDFMETENGAKAARRFLNGSN